MSDRILLRGMAFSGRHGLTDQERASPQPLEVDLELHLDLQRAGVDDDLAKTLDYGRAFEICREVVEATSFKLLEAIAEGIAQEILRAVPVTEVGVRVRKLRVPVSGRLDYAEVEIWRAAARGDR